MNTITSTQHLEAFETMFRRVLSRRPISDATEAEIIEGMKVWSVDCTHPANVDSLMHALFGKGDAPVLDHNRDPDYAVGLSWSNPLTDADIVLTLSRGLQAEIRDHDGEGDDMLPSWYWDCVSDPDTSDESIMLTAINCFVWDCRDALNDYYARCAARPNHISREEFIAIVDEEIALHSLA